MSKRMDKEARRKQLLSIAVSIIESRGADALTLASVAEEAGVTKPIAYNHFETKENLLKQIYQELDKLEPISDENETFRPQIALFFWPLAAALALLMLNQLYVNLARLFSRSGKEA